MGGHRVQTECSKQRAPSASEGIKMRGGEESRTLLEPVACAPGSRWAPLVSRNEPRARARESKCAGVKKSERCLNPSLALLGEQAPVARPVSTPRAPTRTRSQTQRARARGCDKWCGCPRVLPLGTRELVVGTCPPPSRVGHLPRCDQTPNRAGRDRFERLVGRGNAGPGGTGFGRFLAVSAQLAVIQSGSRRFHKLFTVLHSTRSITSARRRYAGVFAGAGVSCAARENSTY